MSLQQDLVLTFPLDEVDEAGSLTFGEASRSPVTIPKTLVAKIWGQVDAGVRMVPRGGAEVGGLLVGPKSFESGVLVDGIIPLSIEYAGGPCFRMSASDLEKLAAQVESVQVDPSKAVVGFYRSQTRGNDTFRDSDREIFDAVERKHTSFLTDFHCYFVLAPISRSEMLAWVSICNGEDWNETEFTLRSNPFSVVQTTFSAARRVNRPADPQVNHTPEARMILASSQTVPQLVTAQDPMAPAVRNAVKAAGSPSKLLYASTCFLALAGGVGGYRFIAKNLAERASRTYVQPSRLGFSAKREGPVWKLSWDRGAMEVMKPSRAVLAIKDGNRSQRLNLTPIDLSNGTILYTPRGDDLAFSFQLERPNTTPIEEHIRVLGGQQKVQQLAERSPQALPENAAVQTKASSHRSPDPTDLIRATNSGPEKVAPVNPMLGASVQPNLALAETAAAPMAGPAETPQPPAEAFAVPVGPMLAAPVDLEIRPGSATPRNAHFPESAVPNASSGTSLAHPTAPPTSVPLAPVPTAVKPNYVGPKPVHQVRPQSDHLNSNGNQIQIHVEIDARGKVTKATPVSVRSADPLLEFMTVRAARAWRFEPATTDGHPTSGEMDLLFKF